MRVTLVGHDYRYAVEQILLHTFPDQKPEFTDETASYTPSDTARAVVKLSRGGTRTTAVTTLTLGGTTYRASAAALSQDLSDVERSRAERRLIQRSFFRAAKNVGKTDIPWGAAAGIRPSTLVTKMLARGVSEAAAARTLEREYFVSPERVSLAIDCARAEFDARKLLQPHDIALYVGIPFCPTRCAYCTFVSNSVERSMALIPPFLDSLHREIDALAGAIDGTGARVRTVYIGGGTPTTLTAAQLGELLARLNGTFDLTHNLEFTVEAGRPDTIDAAKLRVMRDNGVTRVSVNPQTFDDDVLVAIGRRHTAEDTLRAYNLARDAGFDALNMDLIAGLPTDTLDGFRRSLDRALELAPENITVHSLSRKKGSRVTENTIATPEGAIVQKMIGGGIAELRASDYKPYYLYRQKYSSGGLENTGWTQSGFECLYNIVMMDECATVLSLGGGGVTKLVPKSGRISRIFNPKYPYEYTDRIARLCEQKTEIRHYLEREFNDKSDSN
ncbi:MAG: coproporphyrinogen dehydrogenase HemZ [Oscillospiraceae bacterium]|jgi:oxygen-independent coproporphyrinogen-3 oxidase|nr:coproporphyrinogen dehydrogenase HemZ [Oscillospiraceae bacterium]